MHVPARRQCPAAQQPAILGEQDPLLGDRLRDEFGVGRVVAVRRVETEQPHPAGQRAEVDVEHEAGAGDALRPRYRQHLDHVTVHPQLADLGPGYPQRLDDVHRAGPAVRRYRDLAAPVGGRQQEPQRWRDEYPHHFTTPNHSRQSSPATMQ